jgi:hypothetical protein
MKQLPPIFLQTVLRGGGYDILVKDHQTRNHAYCGRHGYQYVFREQDRFSPYTKFRWAKKWFKEGHSHVFLFDADALIVDLSRDMRDTAKGASIAMVQYPIPFYEHPVQYNAGIVYLRNTPESQALLDAILEGDGVRSEQHQLNRLFYDEGPWQFRCNALPFKWNALKIIRTAADDIVVGFHGMGHDGISPLRQEMLNYAKGFPI